MSASNEVIGLISNIKVYWPNFKITKELLMCPNSAFVCSFYTDFLNDYNEKLCQLSGLSEVDPCWEEPIDHISSLGPEFVLFYKMSQIFDSNFTVMLNKFVLGDILQPTHLRTKNFFKLCIHFLRYTDELIISKNFDSVVKIHENTGSLKADKEALIIKSNVLAESLAKDKDCIDELLVEKRELTKELNTIEENASEQEKETVQLQKIRDNLKLLLQNAEVTLANLKQTETNLSELLVSPDEFENLKQTLNIKEKETEKLYEDDVEMENVLNQDRKVQEHCEDCYRMLQSMEIEPLMVSTVKLNRDLIKQITHEIENTEKKVKNSQSVQEDVKKDLVLKKGNLATIKEKYEHLKTNFETNLVVIKEDYLIMTEKYKLQIIENRKMELELKTDLSKLESGIAQFKIRFAEEYKKVMLMEKKIFTSFLEALKTIQKNLES